MAQKIGHLNKSSLKKRQVIISRVFILISKALVSLNSLIILIINSNLVLNFAVTITTVPCTTMQLITTLSTLSTEAWSQVTGKSLQS